MAVKELKKKLLHHEKYFFMCIKYAKIFSIIIYVSKIKLNYKKKEDNSKTNFNVASYLYFEK